MVLENLKQNIREEKEILQEAFKLLNYMPKADLKEREMVAGSLNALINTLKIINNSIPKLLDNISPIPQLEKIEINKNNAKKEIKGLVNVSYEKAEMPRAVTINKEDKERFLQELRLIDFSSRKIKKDSLKEVSFQQFKKPSAYAKISNKFFFNFSNKLIGKGNFIKLKEDLRKANLPFIINTYVSIIFFTTVLACIFSVILFATLIAMKFSILYSIMTLIVIPSLTFGALYFYPYTEKQSIGKKIDQELPFVVIHMAAIAGSGVEPTQIFKIIVLGREYAYVKQEIRKVMNQVNFFGYDLVSALKNSAKAAPSNKLAELFNGIATTISSGGNLPDFFDKRAETLLIDYKLEKEKSTKMAESFMDIYISVVIAAPMILMLLMILMSVGIMGGGLSLTALTVIILSIVALINIVFLAFLQIKQPAY